MKSKVLSAVAALTLFLAGGAQAATSSAHFDLIVEGGNAPKVHKLDNGNYLGLWGFDTRNTKATGGTVTAADITAAFVVGGGSIRNYYHGQHAGLNDGASEFDLVTGPLELQDGTRYYGSLWIEWTGAPLTFKFERKTRTMRTNSGMAFLAGDPTTTAAPVPLPAAAWMLLAGIGGLGAVAHRRGKAAKG